MHERWRTISVWSRVQLYLMGNSTPLTKVASGLCVIVPINDAWHWTQVDAPNRCHYRRLDVAESRDTCRENQSVSSTMHNWSHPSSSTTHCPARWRVQEKKIQKQLLGILQVKPQTVILGSPIMWNCQSSLKLTSTLENCACEMRHSLRTCVTCVTETIHLILLYWVT